MTHCCIFLLISNCVFLLLLVLQDLLYHYLDYCCKIKFFIACENRWPLNFLPYHMFLDTTSVKNLSQTLDFWVSAIVFTSVFTFLCPPGIRLGLAMHSYFYMKFIFCSIWIFFWVVVYTPANVLTVFWHGSSHSSPVPNSPKAAPDTALIYVLGVWVLSLLLSCFSGYMCNCNSLGNYTCLVCNL